MHPSTHHPLNHPTIAHPRNTHPPTDKAVSRGKSYAARKQQLQFDSLWLSTLGLAATWAAVSFEASVSYGFGALLGLGYITLLARSVESMTGGGGPGAWGCFWGGVFYVCRQTDRHSHTQTNCRPAPSPPPHTHTHTQTDTPTHPTQAPAWARRASGW